MQFYYLSNVSRVEHERNIFFRNKEDLDAIYHDPDQQNLVMIIFVEDQDENHLPSSIKEAIRSAEERIKLILVTGSFKDSETMYIKYNEIDPVIKHINDVENAGRVDYVVFLKP